VAGDNEGGEGERVAQFAAGKKTPPKIQQAVIITWWWSGLLAKSRICFVCCLPMGWAEMGDLSPSGSTSWLCLLGGDGSSGGHSQLPDRVVVGPLCKGMLLGLSSAVLPVPQSKISSE